MPGREAPPRAWLLLRGLAREQRHWHEFSTLLSRGTGRARVHLMDVAGTGTQRSRMPAPSVRWLARDVARRLPELAGGGWGVVGLSLGGMIALELCRLFPASFGRAVIINASGRPSCAPARLRPRAALELARAACEPDLVRREARVLSLTSTLPAAERARYAELGAEFARQAPTARASLLAQLLAAAGFRPPAAAELEARLLFVCSRGDALVDPRCSRDLAVQLASPLLEHPSAGHDLPLDDPRWLCERIWQFAGEAVVP